MALIGLDMNWKKKISAFNSKSIPQTNAWQLALRGRSINKVTRKSYPPNQTAWFLALRWHPRRQKAVCRRRSVRVLNNFASRRETEFLQGTEHTGTFNTRRMGGCLLFRQGPAPYRPVTQYCVFVNAKTPLTFCSSWTSRAQEKKKKAFQTCFQTQQQRRVEHKRTAFYPLQSRRGLLKIYLSHSSQHNQFSFKCIWTHCLIERCNLTW
jgi:hypothetical protein